MSKQVEKEGVLSEFIYLILSLVVLRHVIRVFMVLMTFSWYETSVAVINVIISLVMIVCLSFILMKRKWAVYAFFIFQGVSAFLNVCLGSYDLVTAFLLALFLCGLLYGVLQIRKYGISGWDLIMH